MAHGRNFSTVSRTTSYFGVLTTKGSRLDKERVWDCHDRITPMNSTKWRLLADKGRWYDDEFDYTGAACYELGTGGPRGGDIQPHYVGETGNEKKRMSQYASHGSHLSRVIDDHLKRGWSLYYRAWALPSKKAAIKMQDAFLAKYKYDWNEQRNRS